MSAGTPPEHTDACARTILDQLRGPRLPPARHDREVEEYLGYVNLARKQGDPFEEGIATALEAVLVSPKFLYRIERDQPCRRPGAGRSREPVRAGFAPLLLPLEQHARCGIAGRGPARQTAVNPRC